jgi:PAS domain S-box-containing protein
MEHRAHSLLRALLDHLDVAIMVADNSATYVETNEAACRLLQRDRDQIVGYHVSDFLVDAVRETVDLQWMAFLRDGTQSGLFPMRLPSGHQVMTRFSARANIIPGFHCSFLTEASPEETAAQHPRMVTVCSWTHRVRWQNEWLSLGQYMHRAHGISVSHGICPEAFDSLGSR